MASYKVGFIFTLAAMLGGGASVVGATVQLSLSPTNSVLAPGTVVRLEADARAAGDVQRIQVYNGPVLLRTELGSFVSMEAIIREWWNNFYAVAYDASNVAVTSAVHTVRGNVPPIVSMSGGIAGGAFGMLVPVVIKVSAVDNDGTIDRVELRVNGQLTATDQAAPFEFSYTPPEFGVYNFVAVALDNDGATQGVGPLQVTFSHAADNFASAIPQLVGSNITLTESTVGATREKNEPLHAGVSGGKSVWWRWRAPQSGTAIIHTEGSNFDTLLAVYQSGQRTANLTNLVLVAANDDDPWAKPASRVKFSVSAQTTYYIAVDGRDGVAGNAKLSLFFSESSGPVNDMLGAATRWTTVWQGTNIGATKEDGEPEHAGNVGGASIWFRFENALSTAPIEISTEGSSFDTLLAVYTNSAVPNIVLPPFPMSNLRLIASNDDGPDGVRTSMLTFTPPQGYVTYWIAVDGYSGAEGTVKLQIRTLSPRNDPPVRPGNDSFSEARLLTGTAAVTNENSFWATAEPGEPRHAGHTSARTVWWRWIAPTNGSVYVSTRGSEFDTLLAVYTGTRVDALSSVASNDDDPDGLPTSALVFNAVAGTEYYIAVAGYNSAGGEVVLALNQNPAPVGPRLVSQFAAGMLNLRVEGTGGNVVLEASSDLVAWRMVRFMNSAEPVIQPALGEPQQYYRVQVME